MKSILISDHAKWCALMMNGKKNVEVRKGTALYKAIQKLIDEYGFAEFYVYCTKGKRNNEDLAYSIDTNKWQLWYSSLVKLNGKVIFKFRCYKVEEINRYCTGRGISYKTETLNDIELCDKSCLDLIEIDHYLYFKKGCAIHISDLEIFDKPKELSEFHKIGYLGEVLSLESHLADIEGYNGGIDERYVEECYQCLDIDFKLTKAPQSWCYVEVE